MKLLWAPLLSVCAGIVFPKMSLFTVSNSLFVCLCMYCFTYLDKKKSEKANEENDSSDSKSSPSSSSTSSSSEEERKKKKRRKGRNGNRQKGKKWSPVRTKKRQRHYLFWWPQHIHTHPCALFPHNFYFCFMCQYSFKIFALSIQMYSEFKMPMEKYRKDCRDL